LTYHTSINWVNIKSTGYKSYPVETNFPTWEKWFRTLTIQPHNWTDDMHNSYLVAPYPPGAYPRIVERCELFLIDFCAQCNVYRLFSW